MMPENVSVPTVVVDKIIHVLTEHVGDFVCDHELDICFCHERELIKLLRKAKEKKIENVYVPYIKGE